MTADGQDASLAGGQAGLTVRLYKWQRRGRAPGRLWLDSRQAALAFGRVVSDADLVVIELDASVARSCMVDRLGGPRGWVHSYDVPADVVARARRVNPCGD
jgi:hypothetical protein